MYCRKEDIMGKQYSSRDVIREMVKDGWYLDRVKGSHHHFKHPTKKGTIPVPHPQKNIPIGTARNILKQAGLL